MSRPTEPRQSLADACLVDDYDLRALAGRVVRANLVPRKTLARRTEQIRWVRLNSFRRTLALDFDFSHLLSEAAHHGIHVDAFVVGLLPKGMLAELEARMGDGEVLSVINRELDSRLAQALLVAVAQHSDPRLGTPPAPVWKLLFTHCYRFPEDPDFILDPHEQREWARGLASGLSTTTVPSELEAASEWWLQACETPEWVAWLIRLQRDFLLAVWLSPEDASSRNMTVEWTDLNTSANHGAPARLVPGVNRGAVQFELPIYDFGRASSEHVDIVAPEETFLTGGQLVRHLERRVLQPRVRRSLGDISIYQGPRDTSANFGKDPATAVGTCVAQVNVWPAPRAFFSPLRSGAAYAVAILLLLAAAHLNVGLATHVRSSLDATSAILLFLPSLLIPGLFRREENEVRWHLLAGWRALVKWSFAPWFLAFLTLMGPGGRHKTNELLALWFALLAVWAGMILMRISVDAREVLDAYERTQANESMPGKGTRLIRSDPAATMRSAHPGAPEAAAALGGRQTD